MIKDSTVRAAVQAAEREYYQTLKHYHKPHAHGLTYLVSPQYSPVSKQKHQERLIVTFQGKYIHAKIARQTDQPPPPKKRGTITDFSPQSRRRMFDLFHKLNLERKAVFLTLTYGKDYPSAETAKNHLRAFLERIRRLPNAHKTSAIWRMEFQERGAPHFHIVFFDLPYIDKGKVQAMWGQTTGVSNPFTRIEMIRSHKSLMGYVSKYVAKVNPPADAGASGGFNSPTYLHAYQEQYGENIGRVWGTFQKQHLPYAPLITYEIPFTYRKFFKFRDIGIKVFPKIADYLSLSFRLYVRSSRPYQAYFEKLFAIEIEYAKRWEQSSPALMQF